MVTPVEYIFFAACLALTITGHIASFVHIRHLKREHAQAIAHKDEMLDLLAAARIEADARCDQFETRLMAERIRADLAVDKIAALMTGAPISAAGKQERAERVETDKQQRAALKEFYQDEGGEIIPDAPEEEREL